jgi:putative endonuclease
MEKENKRAKGKAGEDLACKYLEACGYRIIERNYQYGHGEIDIVAMDGEELVFVEVKSRKSLEFGEPEFAFTRNKLNQVRKIASAYLVEHDLRDQICRIDAVAVLFQSGQRPKIRLYKNAQK